MSVNLSHDDALRIATRVGAMVGSLYGRPGIVVGIERGGTAVAGAFATGAHAESCVLIRQQRETSKGWRGYARRVIQIITPRVLRVFYRWLLFKLVVRISRRIPATGLALEAKAYKRLKTALGEDNRGLIVVVDDAIDSGATAARVLAGLEELAPNARVIMFALTSTVGARVADHQLNVFSDIIEYQEGDIGDLAASHRETAQWDRSTVDRSAQPSTAEGQLLLYLDLDGTLVMDSFRCARNILFSYQWHAGQRAAALRLLWQSFLKKLRLLDHHQLKKFIDLQIRELSLEQNEQFQRQLSETLDLNARWTLAAIANAPNVQSKVVTAALASYSKAIEQALGVPVLVASERDPEGTWLEVDSGAKVAAVCADRNGSHRPDDRALLVGNAIVDALATTDGVAVTILPVWDQTGLLTILGADAWWRRR